MDTIRLPHQAVFSARQKLDLRSCLGEKFDAVIPQLEGSVFRYLSNVDDLDRELEKSWYETLTMLRDRARAFVAQNQNLWLFETENESWISYDGPTGRMRKLLQSNDQLHRQLLTYIETLDSMRELSEAKPRRGAPKKSRFQLEESVLYVLFMNDVPLKKSRDGVLARVLSVTIEMAGEVPPQDMFEVVKRLVDLIDHPPGGSRIAAWPERREQNRRSSKQVEQIQG